MLVQQIALVSGSAGIGMSDLTQVSAAVQKQITRDVAPLWSVSATIDTFPTLEDVPVGYWKVYIVDQVDGAEGFHQDENGQPYAVVKFENDKEWSVTVSHECIEMLVDPFGNRMVPGPSPMPDQGRVNFLVEVCDPSESSTYTVNDVAVSDFYTPHYFDPEPINGVRYSYLGVLTQPRQVLDGGYLSWVEPISNEWWQLFVDNGQNDFRKVPMQNNKGVSNRVFIDQYSRQLAMEKKSRGAEALEAFHGLSARQSYQRQKRAQSRLVSQAVARRFAQTIKAL